MAQDSTGFINLASDPNTSKIDLTDLGICRLRMLLVNTQVSG
jgi:hypothetical protein